MGSDIRVLIVDDHPVVREGVRTLLSTIPGLEVVGAAADGAEGVSSASKLRPDVVLMDLVMPEMDGVEAIRQILAQCPESSVLVLSGSSSVDKKIYEAVREGALGYLSKDAEPDDFGRAIRQVHRGEPFLSPELTRKLISSRSMPTPAPETLTPREVEILRLVSRGWDDDRISDHLHVAKVTVRTHVKNILGKLSLGNRVEATLYALRRGLVKLDESEPATS